LFLNAPNPAAVSERVVVRMATSNRAIRIHNIMDRSDVPTIRCEELHNRGGNSSEVGVTGWRLVCYDLGKDAGFSFERHVILRPEVL